MDDKTSQILENYDKEVDYTATQVRDILYLKEQFPGMRSMAVSFLSGNTNAVATREFVDYIKAYCGELEKYGGILGGEVEAIKRIVKGLEETLNNNLKRV